MSNTSATVPIVRPKQGRANTQNPYQSMGTAGPPHGPSWTTFNTVVTIGMGIIIALVSVVYLNVKEDIKGLRDDGKDIRALQMQSNRDITDLRISLTKISSQLDGLLQKSTGSK